MIPIERLERLEGILDQLRQAAVGAAVIVEGRRDKEALEQLGVGGKHLLVHTGMTLEARIDQIAEEAGRAAWPRVILLTDWDRTGGRLRHRLERGLIGRVPLDTTFMRSLGQALHAVCVEDVPAELASLRAQAGRI